MKRYLYILVTVFGVSGMVFLSAETRTSQTGVPGPSRGGGLFQAVAVDSAGNKLAAGYVTNAVGINDFAVIKFDRERGDECWRRVIEGSANGNDEARALALDGAGNAVAVGSLRNIGTDFDFTVIKFDGASGMELWRRVIDGGTGGADAANAVALDRAGNVIVAGYTTGSGTYGDFTVVKLDRESGAELWRQTMNGSAGGFDVANAVAVDRAGDVIAVGVTVDAGYAREFTVIKLDGANGVVLWRQQPRNASHPGVTGEAKTVAIDARGNAVVAGVTSNPGAPRPSFVDFTVMKFEGSTGGELWRQTINGRADDLDYALAVALDNRGNAIAAGYTNNRSSNSSDFTVVKLDGRAGRELWRQTIQGGVGGVDSDNRALAVTVDRRGNAVAAGFIMNTPYIWDFTVVKFDGTAGTERWRQVLGGPRGFGQAFAVTVDGAGDPVAAGAIEGVATVIEFKAATGKERMRASAADSASGGDDSGLAIAVGAVDSSGPKE